MNAKDKVQLYRRLLRKAKAHRRHAGLPVSEAVSRMLQIANEWAGEWLEDAGRNPFAELRRNWEDTNQGVQRELLNLEDLQNHLYALGDFAGRPADDEQFRRFWVAASLWYLAQVALEEGNVMMEDALNSYEM